MKERLNGLKTTNDQYRTLISELYLKAKGATNNIGEILRAYNRTPETVPSVMVQTPEDFSKAINNLFSIHDDSSKKLRQLLQDLKKSGDNEGNYYGDIIRRMKDNFSGVEDLLKENGVIPEQIPVTSISGNEDYLKLAKLLAANQEVNLKKLRERLRQNAKALDKLAEFGEGVRLLRGHA